MAIASAQSNASGLFVGLKFDGLCKRKSPAETVFFGKEKQAIGGTQFGENPAARTPFREAFKSCKASGQVSWLELVQFVGPCWLLWNRSLNTHHSGATARDSHPLPYSPRLTGHPDAFCCKELS
jgi:hypothetical protein